MLRWGHLGRSREMKVWHFLVEARERPSKQEHSIAEEPTDKIALEQSVFTVAKTTWSMDLEGPIFCLLGERQLGNLFYYSFIGCPNVKEQACQCRRHKSCGFDPGPGRSPGKGYDHPIQYSCLENPMEEKPGSCSPQGLEESDMTEAT